MTIFKVNFVFISSKRFESWISSVNPSLEDYTLQSVLFLAFSVKSWLIVIVWVLNYLHINGHWTNLHNAVAYSEHFSRQPIIAVVGFSIIHVQFFSMDLNYFIDLERGPRFNGSRHDIWLPILYSVRSVIVQWTSLRETTIMSMATSGQSRLPYCVTTCVSKFLR